MTTRRSQGVRLQTERSWRLYLASGSIAAEPALAAFFASPSHDKLARQECIPDESLLCVLTSRCLF